jgi:hypothetical protein
LTSSAASRKPFAPVAISARASARGLPLDREGLLPLLDQLGAAVAQGGALGRR